MSSEEEISSIADNEEEEYQDYDKHDFEDIQFERESQEDMQQQSKDESQEQRQKSVKAKGIQFRIPKKIVDKENQLMALADTTIKSLNTQAQKNRPSTGTASGISSYKPIYTTSINTYQQQQKNYNYKQKSFNTLPKKSDPVARYQQMNQVWNKTKFLRNNTNAKEGRKLQLDARIETQKQQLRESGMFHKYITKSQLFL